MPRASLDEIFGGSSAPVPLYQPANENDRNAAITDVYQPPRKSLDAIFGGQQPQAPMPQPPMPQSDNRFMADEPGFEYDGMLPFRVNNQTGKVDKIQSGPMAGFPNPVWPEMIRSPIRGMQDLENTAASGEVATGNPTITPDALNAMAFMLPFVGNFPAETSAAQAFEKPNTSKSFLANNQGEASANASIPTSEQLREVSSSMFNEGKGSAVSLNPEVANIYADKANSMTPQTEGAQIVFGKPSPAEEVASNIQGLRDRPLTLAETQEIDSRLGQLAEDHFDKIKGDYDSDGTKYLQLQHHLRDTWQNATENDVTGGKDAYNKIVQARDVWGAQARMRDIERIEERAKLSENPQTVIKNGAKKLLTNWRGSDEERAALEAAAKSGVLGGALKLASSKAIDAFIGAMVGHATGDPYATFAGGTLGTGIGRAAGALGNKLQAGRLANVKGAIADNPAVQSAFNPQYPPVGFNQ